MELKMDSYAIQARLFPALLVVLPLVLLSLVALPGGLDTWKVVGTMALAFGLGTLLSHLGRDLGKKKEPGLFKAWGGMPTTLMLSHHRSTLNPTTLARYHDNLSTLLPHQALPSQADERANQEAADQTYRSCVDYLREATRDTAKFPLVFAENVSYGFRRNLWAMKPAGVVSTIIGLVGTALVATTRPSTSPSFLPVTVASLALDVTLLTWWVLRITPGWIRTAADSYAERLLGATDQLVKQV